MVETSWKDNAAFKLFHHSHTAINALVCMILLQFHHSNKLQRLRFALILASITPLCIRIHCTSTHTCTLLVHYTLSGKHITSQSRMDPSLCHSIRTANRPSYTADNKQSVYSCILINNAPSSAGELSTFSSGTNHQFEPQAMLGHAGNLHRSPCCSLHLHALWAHRNLNARQREAPILTGVYLSQVGIDAPFCCPKRITRMC